MIKGTYIFYEDGKEIYRSSNILTRFGKRFLTNFIAGNVSFSSKDMAFGIDGSKFITNISATGSVVTYTTSTAHTFIQGAKVTIYGVSPTQYNLSNVTIASVPSSTQFTISSTATGAYVSGGNVVSDVDTRLGFEFYRMPISFGSIDIQPNGSGGYLYYVIYKATIPQDVAGEIKEIAMYPGTRTSSNNYDSKFIADFENNLLWIDSSSMNPTLVYTPAARIGSGMIEATAGVSSTKEYVTSVGSFDISGYSVNDSLALAYYKNDANLSNIKVRFYSVYSPPSGSSYYEATFTPAAGTGHRVESISMNSLFSNQVGTPDASAISKIGIIVTATSGGSSTAYFDGIRINDEDTFDPTLGMISRSILTTALSKTAGRQVDVEYKLELGF